MRKFSFALLLVITVFSFSGRPASSKNLKNACGSWVTIHNYSGLTVTKLRIYNADLNLTTTVNNPTFPYSQFEQGLAEEVTVYFSSDQSGTMVLYTNDAFSGECAQFSETRAWNFPFNASCNWYDVEIWDTSVSCP